MCSDNHLIKSINLPARSTVIESHFLQIPRFISTHNHDTCTTLLLFNIRCVIRKQFPDLVSPSLPPLLGLPLQLQHRMQTLPVLQLEKENPHEPPLNPLQTIHSTYHLPEHVPLVMRLCVPQLHLLGQLCLPRVGQPHGKELLVQLHFVPINGH